MILMSQVLSDNLIKNLDEGVMKSWLQSVLPSVLGFFLECGAGTAYRLHWW